MSKSSHVKAAAHGGPASAGGGGGPAGTWVLLRFDQQAISANQNLTLFSVASPGPAAILVPFVSFASGQNGNHLTPGSTAVAPNVNTIVYDLTAVAGNIELKARAGGTIIADTLVFALYMFLPTP